MIKRHGQICAVNCGGNWNNGSNVGFYWNGNNEPTDTNINIGGRLFLLVLIERVCSYLRRRNRASHSVLVAGILRTFTRTEDD